MFNNNLLMAAVAATSSSYVTRAVHCEGDDDAARGADLTGASDGKEISCSFWIKTTNSSENYLMSSHTAGADTSINDSSIGSGTAGDGKWGLTVYNTSDSKIGNVWTNTAINDGEWHHVAMSMDLLNGVGVVYVDGVEDKASGAILTNDTIDLTDTDWRVFTDNSSQLTADVADLWINFNYIDFSDSATRAKFINSSGKPVDLGDDGSTPTGTKPIMYFKLAADVDAPTFYTNKGSGGGFGTVSGTLTEASSSPSD